MTPRLPPALLLVIFAVIGWGLASVFPGLDYDGISGCVLGIICIGFGGILLAVSVGAFRVARTTVNPLAPEKAQTLVKVGLYRLSRNPMYLAMALALFGVAFLLANIASFAAPIVFVGLMTEFQIKPEERALKEKFGEEFITYCRQTRRWI